MPIIKAHLLSTHPMQSKPNPDCLKAAPLEYSACRFASGIVTHRRLVRNPREIASRPPPTKPAKSGCYHCNCAQQFREIEIVQLDKHIGRNQTQDIGTTWKNKGRWRTERDSNPRYAFTYTRVPGVRLQPLGHLSLLSKGCLAVLCEAAVGADIYR